MEIYSKAQVSLFFVAFPNNQYKFIFQLGHVLLQVKKILKIIKNTNVSLAEGACNHIHQRILVPIPISQYMVGTSLPHPIRNTELKALVFNSYLIQLSNIAISVQLTGRELHIFRHFLLSIISSLQLVIRITERKTILELKIQCKFSQRYDHYMQLQNHLVLLLPVTIYKHMHTK